MKSLFIVLNLPSFEMRKHLRAAFHCAEIKSCSIHCATIHCVTIPVAYVLTHW